MIYTAEQERNCYILKKILPLKNAKEILISMHDKQYKRRKKKNTLYRFFKDC